MRPMRRRPWSILLLALACGGSAAYLSLLYLRGMATPASAPQAPGLQLVAAARDLPGGAILHPEDLKLIPWSGEALPAGYLNALQDAVGHGLTVPVRANEPLLTSKMAGKGAIGGLSLVIPAGMRAISVRVDEVIAVAGFVVPGSRVDVLVTLSAEGASGGTTTRVVLQNVQVLAVGQSMQADAEGEPLTASVITLLVSPGDAEVLALAAAEGQIHLALRNALDPELARTPGARVGRLSGGPEAGAERETPTRRAPAPARRPTGSAIEIYHGNNRTVVSF